MFDDETGKLERRTGIERDAIESEGLGPLEWVDFAQLGVGLVKSGAKAIIGRVARETGEAALETGAREVGSHVDDVIADVGRHGDEIVGGGAADDIVGQTPTPGSSAGGARSEMPDPRAGDALDWTRTGPADRPAIEGTTTVTSKDLETRMLARRNGEAVDALADVPALQEAVRQSTLPLGDGRTTLTDLAAESPTNLRDLWSHWEAGRASGDIKSSFDVYVRNRTAREFRGGLGEFTEAFVRGEREIVLKSPKPVTERGSVPRHL